MCCIINVYGLYYCFHSIIFIYNWRFFKHFAVMTNVKFRRVQLSVKIYILYGFVYILQTFRLVMNNIWYEKNGFIWEKNPNIML